jgi:hypothetical protein
MKSKRHSTVEPVFGTLTQFMGLRKLNTLGIQQANKVMQLSAAVYNLKKYLKFIENRVKSGIGSTTLLKLLKTTLQQLINFHLRQVKSKNPVIQHPSTDIGYYYYYYYCLTDYYYCLTIISTINNVILQLN